MHDIIYLEPDEEITSIIDKLKVLNPEIKTVSLVVPKGAALIQSVVNLKLLKRQGEVLEKDLSIVTQDRIGRNLASQAGFTVFDNINSTNPIAEIARPQPNAEEIIEFDLTGKKSEEEKPIGLNIHRYDDNLVAEEKPELPMEDFSEKKISDQPVTEPGIKSNNEGSHINPLAGSSWNSRPKDEETIPVGSYKSSTSSKKKKILTIIISLLIIAAGTLFYFYYPKAIISLAVKSDPFEQPMEITIDNSIIKNDVSKKSIPGINLESEQETTKQFPATGKKDVGQKATGTVTISNDSGTATALGTGSKLTTGNNLSFITTKDISVPGATASVDSGGNVVKISGKTDVTVEAENPGDQYNIAASDFSVNGHSMLTGKSLAVMSGGSTQQLTIVSQSDINTAKEQLSKEIYTALHGDLSKKANGDKILDSGIKDEIISSSSDKNIGDTADNFQMKVKVKSATISFKETDYRAMVVEALQSLVPADKELVLSSSDEIATSASELDLAHGQLKIKGSVKTRLAPKIDQTALKNSIKGKGSAEVESIIKQNPAIETVSTTFRPSWWLKKVPSLDKNIQINIEYK